MPRRARIVLDNVPLHLIQRGNNRQVCYFSDDDRRVFLELLAKYAFSSGCRIHAYVLMTNHFHLLLSPEAADSPGKLMKALGQHYVQYANRKYRRSGTLWEGRFRSCPTQEDAYFFSCMRYIELNPVRAGMVKHPAAFPWSSYHANADGETDQVARAHPLYEALGRTAESRQAAYRELFRHDPAPGLVAQIRQATNGNFALGSKRFAKQISAVLGRPAFPGKAGRPKKVLGIDSSKPLPGMDSD